VSAARELAEAISLGVRERRLRRAGYSKREIDAPPMPLDAHPESDQTNWLDTAEAVLTIYGHPPDPSSGRSSLDRAPGVQADLDEGMGAAPETDASAFWQTVAILGALCSLAAMAGSVVLVLSGDWTKGVYVIAFATWVMVCARGLWREST
jgi:hypothetical protein